MKLKLTGGWRNEWVTQGAALGYKITPAYGQNFWATKLAISYFVRPIKGDTMKSAIERAIETKKQEEIRKVEREKKFPTRLPDIDRSGQFRQPFNLGLMVAICAGMGRRF